MNVRETTRWARADGRKGIVTARKGATRKVGTAEKESVETAETPEAPRRDLSRCYVTSCRRPEVADGVGLCGAHYALRGDLRKVARHG